MMIRNRLTTALAAALLASVALVGCKKKEEPAPPPVAAEPAPVAEAAAPITAAASVSGVDLGNAVGADMRVAAPMTTFAPKDTIHASVSTATTDPMASVPGTLGVKWTHMDSNQTVHEETKDVTFTGDGVTDFQISKPGGWPTGKYKVEVALDGNVVQTREFEVR
jgi:hypothetical protein